ncbi:uncharacterized protein LOC123549549 [Mercenaria mercenaria]|uniref:uncharacterized protein LOC123549549 n=1 Tax=Mercenaria mercenaria TaxID=6596 RepID=UPI001E1D427A|nr:uncharacterized protein LOC123549549 [Mercenaria mercenaria]XP_045193655.1 uncharacterized protein LOC123549549 [Mercenaria mercenaria]XP_045193656.1 uncharacterized protein LOC123549549 [Mercenaria mercenaria]XP_045193657.1 uncharacterized protein LOC123549549 [Mercenaria mercenaria]XP_045193658.1 uncharacterized protein LOC123549549 [Mercenaria mercenaria]XP_045193659.1 uncharacterized protein LOC123549549 [Mercenaria mercenaria]XP_045193660.1 uncharacterized protein LOC123549549 [Mercen
MRLDYNNKSLREVTMTCDADEIARIMYANTTHISMYFVITLSAVAVFVGTKKIFSKVRREMAQMTVVVVGAGPIGLTSALIAVQCKRVKKLVLYEEQSKSNVERRSYQIAIQSSNVSLLRSYGIDFDNLEGLWHNGCFYTRVGIYLEYIIHVLPLYSTEVEINFGTKFCRESSDVVDNLTGRKLVICCDGSTGLASRALGLSDECVMHSSGIFGAVAAIERNNQTLVPTPEKRVHNLSFDLSAYVSSAYEDDGRTNFTLKIFGNSKCRYLALAVNKCDSNVVRALKTVLDKSMMRNIFLKCFNTYKRSDEASISDSYCLNNMKFSPRMYEIKLSQRIESVAYISDCDLFIITEGEASRSYNYNTGMDINIGLKGLTALQPFIEKVTLAETEHSIMKSLLFKMEHSDRICTEFLKFGLREYMFL